MYTHCLFKNKLYKLSKCNYLCDYSKIESKKIDMTLSGKYLAKRKIEIPLEHLDEYPNHFDIEKLENKIKENIKTKCEIIIGNGTNGLLQNIIKILFNKKGNLVTPFYTFNQAEYAVTSFDGITKRVYTKNYNIDLESIKKSIDKKTRMVYICNPNNPTGNFIKISDLIEFVKKIKIPVVIDESSIEFTNELGILEVISRLPSNLIVLRTFSKAYGIANLRIGYLACSKKFKEEYLQKITINEFSGISCLVALSVLNDKKSLSDNITKTINEKKCMEENLKKLGISIVDSYSNIIFTKTYFDVNLLKILNDNDISVVPIYDKLGNMHIRIAIQDSKTNKEFIKKLKNIFEKENLIIGVYED